MKQFNELSDPGEMTRYLSEHGWLGPGEEVRSLAKAGEGNMNVVLRLHTDRRTLILKQSRPFVQKYPEIPAPLERIVSEFRFYQAVASAGISANLPSILGFDTQSALLLMENLDGAADLTALYAARAISDRQLATLVRVLGQVHTCAVPDDFPANQDLRKLNHQHIFVLPFAGDNGFSLDTIQPGLQELSLPYKADARLKERIAVLGEMYLSPGKVLLHGDYYPGSWMGRDNEVFVIDPEFCFAGFAEFDLGVMAAHLVLTTGFFDIADRMLDLYGGNPDVSLVRAMAGTEIMRRLIGLAQLPLERSLDEKAVLLNYAHSLICND